MLRNLPSISANKLILSSKITLSERSCILSGFISRKKATTVLKTRLSLKERWEYAAGKCKSRNSNKTKIFYHEAGEMHAI